MRKINLSAVSEREMKSPKGKYHACVKKMLGRLLQSHQRYAWRRLERLRGKTHVPRDEPEYVAVPLQPAFTADNRLVSKNCPSTNCSHD